MTVLLASIALFPATLTAPAVDTTAYSPCSSGTITASGEPVHAGIAAANWLPLGTWIRVTPAALGRAIWRIMDRVGYGTQLDLWTPSCAAAVWFGRRRERVTILGR